MTNDITCMKNFSTLKNPCEECDVEDCVEREEYKYKKKKSSSVSKSRNKSKHKHEYVDCLFIEDGKKPHKGEYCKICGKIGNMFFWDTEIDETTGYRRVLTSEETFEKYKDLERIYIDDVWQKYAPISK